MEWNGRGWQNPLRCRVGWSGLRQSRVEKVELGRVEIGGVGLSGVELGRVK